MKKNKNKLNQFLNWIYIEKQLEWGLFGGLKLAIFGPILGHGDFKIGRFRDREIEQTNVFLVVQILGQFWTTC